MSVEQNKENIRRHVEDVWNKGDLSIIPDLIAPDYVIHPNSGQEYKGTDGFKQIVEGMRNSFPDLKYTIDSMVGEGEFVAVRYSATGTFAAGYGNVAPTGKKLNRTESIFHRFKNGKQVEAWTYADSLSMYQQLGIPIPQS
jgi:steroid delta-isomerase-like uncharacterized protein